MSEQSSGRTERPIERGFPIERINEIVEKESRAKQWYRPIYTMHKWWARRPGSLFRAIILYSLIDEDTDPAELAVYEPGENRTLGSNGHSAEDLLEAAAEVDMDDPESLWEFYPKDVRLPEDTKVLDPFMGGGTSLVEASRFGVESVGYDLNPVAWFVTKKQLEAGQTDVEELQRAFEQVKDDVADEIRQYYKTPCPNGGEDHPQGAHDADVMYNFWVKELDCTSCGHTVPLFKDYRVAAGRYENDDQYNVLCPDCGAVTLVDDWQAEESECGECFATFDASEGNVGGGDYICPECGQRESTLDAIQEQDGYDTRLYAVEYYCPECDKNGADREQYKGYKQAEIADQRLFRDAEEAWADRTDLHEYVPDEDIPLGIKTDSSQFEGSIGGGFNLLRKGYDKWTDMFNDRQLLCLSLLLKSIDKIEDQQVMEFFLLIFSESLNYNTNMVVYNAGRNHAANIFKTNSFDIPQKPIENNVWGTEYGIGNFRKMYDMVKRAVDYAESPTDRFIQNDETVETEKFAMSIGERSSVNCGDMRTIPEPQGENERYDMILTDPPYYDNVIYSELSDYYFVWLKQLLEDEYDAFSEEKTPRDESIVANPAAEKGVEEFEDELNQAFTKIRSLLKNDGALAFTYHHSERESWAELLTALCKNGFEVTATYPISADLNKSTWRLTEGGAVNFDIVIVARPTDDRQPTSWNSLRREIVRTAKRTRETLEETRDLTSGDIGVIEMGKCFQAYSKHHGEVRRGGEIMDAKEVVDEIYGIIQESDRGESDVYLDMLEEHNPSYSDLNKHLKRSDASEDRMREMALFRSGGDGFELLDWRDEARLAYVRERVEGDEGTVTELDRAHFLRDRYENDQSRDVYLERWDRDSLQEVCEDLAAITGDETYLKMLGVDTTLAELGGD